MQKLFNNILVPVTAGNANHSIEKSIEFANQLQCHVHLVGVDSTPVIPLLKTTWVRRQTRARKTAEQKDRLSSLENKYGNELEKGLRLSTHATNGNAEEALATFISLHEIDLVLIDGERNGFPFLKNSINASRLAARINCPVLYLQSHPALNDLKIIVMPVGRSLPINKIRVAAYLAKLYCASIHLVTREKNGLMYEELAYMQKALQVLKDNTDLPVKCKTLSGESLGDIALQYAHEVHAGLILINPGQESFLPGMINRIFSRFVFNESKIPVMMVV